MDLNKKWDGSFLMQKLWRYTVLYGCLVFLGCAQIKPVEKPVVEVKKGEERPFPTEGVKEEASQELEPSIDKSILEDYLLEIEFALANLDLDEEETKKKGLSEGVFFQIGYERERLSKRKKIVEEIQGIQEYLELIEGVSDRAKLRRVVTRKLLELSKIYPNFSIDISKLSLPAGEEPYPKIQNFIEVIETALRENRHEDLISSYEAFKAEYPEAKIPPEIHTSYAISLQKSGDTANAIEEMKEALEDGAFIIDVSQLRYLLGSWLYEEGRYDEAIEIYQGLDKEMEKQKRWVDLAGVKISMIEIAKERKAANGETEMAGTYEPPAEEKGVKEGDLPPEEKVEEIPIVASQLHPAELNTREIPTEERKQKADTAIFEEANRLYDRAEYDEAIKLYKMLAGSIFEEEGNQRMQEAMDRFTQKKRKEAVQIFLKAKKSPDPEEKKVLFVTVLKILQDINQRYPTNRYAGKVKSNIDVVVKELKKVDSDYME